ncbi:uncharacterized protein LOC121253439 [Juglans microcarpa x Juglans regia]|uniref:uncharacterized protein LOC121253439 n=1 Tax=Juglans microcarpa x Juglans regia TaxID=2249226 RepID=UPI001B7E638C|nr:uncharacterized protein LOC121253439 [Juglans microcarpa x Juglans regia]
MGLGRYPVVSTMRRPRNVFIRMVSEEDCMKALSREACDMDGIPYRAFHWTPEFKEEEEPSIVPVWIALPGLPPNFYHESLLKILTAPIGRFIRRDNPTRFATRTNGARLCVEMDVAIEPISHFWIGMPGLGSSQKQEIVYETLPAFCSICKIQGHNVRTCWAGKQKLEKKMWVRQQPTDGDQEPDREEPRVIVLEEPKELVTEEPGVEDQSKLVLGSSVLAFPRNHAEQVDAEYVDVNLVLGAPDSTLMIEELVVDTKIGEAVNTESLAEVRQTDASLQSEAVTRETEQVTETKHLAEEETVITEEAQRIDDAFCLEEGSLSDPEPDILAEVFS